MLQRLGGVLIASAMMLAGCMAPTDDDDAWDEGAAALVEEETTTGGDGTPIGASPLVPEPVETITNVVDSVTGNVAADPQPNPWVPTANLPVGPHDPGPSPMQQKTR